MISIRMIKICDTSICKPSELIFRSCLKSGKFPTEWEKANVVQYRPISLPPVAGKIFERILYNKMYEFFTEDNLISPNQSDFTPGEVYF